MAEVMFELVDEVPDSKRRRASQYDNMADQVRKTGKVARISSTQKAMSSVAQALKKRYPDLDAYTRTLDDGFFVFLAQKESK